MRFDKVLSFDLEEIYTCGGTDSFNDLVMNKSSIGTNFVVSDISFKPVRVKPDGTIQIRVQANLIDVRNC